LIYGIGTDIVRIDRIAGLYDRYGERFARRLLAGDELIEFARRLGKSATRISSTASPENVGKTNAIRYLAKRFAAKEALSKALGIGIRHPMTLLSVEILNNQKGQPYARPRLALAQFFVQEKLSAHVSISDEIDAALAFVIVEKVVKID
jgi:holo-[acyl-carrier protein] synthase